MAGTMAAASAESSRCFIMRNAPDLSDAIALRYRRARPAPLIHPQANHFRYQRAASADQLAVLALSQTDHPSRRASRALQLNSFAAALSVICHPSPAED